MRPYHSRLAVLQRRRFRRARAPEVAAAWALEGVTVSLLSDDRQEDLVEQIRGSGSRTNVGGSLQSIIAQFADAGDMAVIFDWDIDNEPALLIRSNALVQPSAPLRAIYPDGFVAADEEATRALIVDFDDIGFQAYLMRLPAKS